MSAIFPIANTGASASNGPEHNELTASSTKTSCEALPDHAFGS